MQSLDIEINNNVLEGKIAALQAELAAKNKELQNQRQIVENSLKQVALIIEEREFTKQQLEQLNAARQNNFDEIVELLAEVIEAKRHDHPKHSRNVADIAQFVADQLGLAPPNIKHVKSAALLHELGTLFIADEVLKQPQEYFSQQEKELINRHPLKGATLIEKFSALKDAAKIVRHLNEHVDGSGIPDGLHGRNIPLESRIVAAACFFDNLIYRQKDQSVNSILETMESLAGAQFDAEIIHSLHKYTVTHPMGDAYRTKELSLWELQPDMILAKGIFSLNGAKLLPINTTLTQSTINHLINYHKKDPLEETIFIKR